MDVKKKHGVEVPMDKYARQSHKTYQRARRRNNTAENVLENRLRQLDKDIRLGHVHYLRSKTRVTAELSNLESNSSDFDLLGIDNIIGSKTKESNHPDRRSHTSTFKHVGGNATGQYEDILQTTGIFGSSPARSKILKRPQHVPSLYSPSSRPAPNVMSSRVIKAELPTANFVTSNTPINSRIHSERDFLDRKCRSDNDKEESCDYKNFNLGMPRTCNHFPCKCPRTYHTMGFRREDLCPRTDDPFLHTTTTINNNENDCFEKTHATLSPYSASSSIHPNKYDIITNLQNANNNTTTTTSTNSNSSYEWTKTNDKGKRRPFEFRPPIHGPVFGFTPTDPVLERIRHHRVEPKLNASRPCARITIQDRIRGVKQLIKEMKMSNEKVKPNDWATNYGKRVPTRVLLNPVVPV